MFFGYDSLKNMTVTVLQLTYKNHEKKSNKIKNIYKYRKICINRKNPYPGVLITWMIAWLIPGHFSGCPAVEMSLCVFVVYIGSQLIADKGAKLYWR